MTLELGTAGPGLALAVKPRRQWYQQRPEDLPPLGAGEPPIIAALAGFGELGATISVLAKALPDTDPLDLRRAASALERKGCITLKGASMYVTGQGRMHLEKAAQGDEGTERDM
jgi:hypothetical protein